MKNQLLINATLFAKNTLLPNHYLFIKNGIIEDYGSMSNDFNLDGDFDVYDCENHILSPGFIDCHVHFRDPGYKHKEDITSGVKSAIAGGFTTVAMMPNTSPVIDNSAVTEYLNRQIENFDINIKYFAAATKGMLGKEISPVQTLIKNGAIGFTDDGMPISNSQIMLDLFEYSARYNIPIAQHAEDHNITNHGCVNHGTFSEKYNIKTIHKSSEYSVIARDIALLQSINKARYHVLHVSCAESLKYIRQAKNDGLNVTCEVTPHHFLLTDDCLHEHWSEAKMNPPLRNQEDIDAIINAMKDGTIDIIASDHAPHDSDSKNQPISCATFGILGLETMLPLSLELYHKGALSLERILTLLTSNSALLLNENKRGKIEKGYIAELVLFDPNFEWIIDKDFLNSKSKNTPFDKRSVKGKVFDIFIPGR